MRYNTPRAFPPAQVLAIGREQRSARREIMEALARIAPATSTSATTADCVNKSSSGSAANNKSSSGSAAGVGIGQQPVVKPPQLMAVPAAVPTAPPAPDSGPREAPENGPDAGAGASNSGSRSPDSMEAVLQKMEALAAEVASLRSAAVCQGVGEVADSEQIFTV
jgi:hypothetical protein